MPRGRKLTTEQIQEAACDRRNGMTWKALSKKYRVAVNTIRFTLSEYSDEFNHLLNNSQHGYPFSKIHF